MGITLPHGAPEFRQISLHMLRLAYRRAASDMRRAPLFGLFFAGFYVLLGWILLRISLETGQSYWLVLTVGGFPIIAPFPPWDYTRYHAGWRRMNPCHGATFWA